MELDEQGMRLEAEKFQRSLPDEVRDNLHEDDVYGIIRRNRMDIIAHGKSTRGITAVVGVGCLVAGFLVGSTISTGAAWGLGIVGAFLGFKFAEGLASKRVAKEHSEKLISSLGELVISATKK